MDQATRIARFPSIPFVKIGIGVTFVFAISGGLYYFFFRKHIIDEGSNVASAIMTSHQTKVSLDIFVKDPETIKITDEFLKARITVLINEPWLNELLLLKINQLSKDTISNEENKKEIQKLFTEVLASQETIDVTTKSLRKASLGMFDPRTWTWW